MSNFALFIWTLGYAFMVAGFVMIALTIVYYMAVRHLPDGWGTSENRRTMTITGILGLAAFAPGVIAVSSLGA